MTGVTYFVALPIDVAGGSVVIGEPVECPSPAAAIERAQGLWKVFGHTGAVAFSRTGDPATGDFRDATVCGGLATCRMSCDAPLFDNAPSVTLTG